jgi:Pvc16 N-terminal domain
MPTANLYLVTETIRRLIDFNVRALLLREGLPTTLNVTTMPPERVGSETHTINLHLYHVMEDAFYKNRPPPGDGHPPIARQPLVLSLFYILTAHHATHRLALCR